ncbi:MAG: hypothetical protein V4665_02540 [Patescibacteria group bacterium]
MNNFIVQVGQFLIVVYYRVSSKAIIDSESETILLKDGRYCFAYSHDATETEPYAVQEFIDITVDGVTVAGTKKGTQNGPDMTNGYEGTLMGTLDNDIITGVFSYIIEGSANKEGEIYKIKKDHSGIEKVRYPLSEGKGILFPDTTKEYKTLLYSQVECALKI